MIFLIVFGLVVLLALILVWGALAAGLDRDEREYRQGYRR